MFRQIEMASSFDNSQRRLIACRYPFAICVGCQLLYGTHLHHWADVDEVVTLLQYHFTHPIGLIGLNCIWKKTFLTYSGT